MRQRGAVALALALGAASTASARADTDLDVEANAKPEAGDLVASGGFLPTLQPAGSNRAAASAMALGGYDSARRTPLFFAITDVRLLSWLTLRGAIHYNPSDNTGDDRSRARPSVALRAQLFEQGRSGVDVSLVAAYRQERFAEDGGLVDLTAAVGRQMGRLSLIGNLGAAADPEGDDIEGQVGGAAVWRASASVNVGGQGLLRRDLGSTDPRRTMRNGESYDFAAGPLVLLSRESLTFTLQASLVGVHARDSVIGVMGLAGMGAVF